MSDSYKRGAAVLMKYGEGRWGDDVHRGLSEDGPLRHSVDGWASRLGVPGWVIERALAAAMRRRAPLREPFGNITFACLELLRTPEGCSALYRVVAEEIEFEQRVRNAMGAPSL